MRSSLFALALLLALDVRALEAKRPGPDWEEANRNDTLVIFTRDNPKVGSRDIVAIMEADAPPKAVFAAVTDFANYTSFMPYVKESTLVSRQDDTHLTVYALLTPPLVDNRDYVLDVTLAPGNESNGGVYKSSWTPAPEKAPLREKVIRIRINTGAWILEPIDGGQRTRVTYQLSTHPGGSIPNWIADKSNTVAIPSLFKVVRAEAARRK